MISTKGYTMFRLDHESDFRGQASGRVYPRRHYGHIARANLPIEVFRTERPIRRFIRNVLRKGART